MAALCATAVVGLAACSSATQASTSPGSATGGGSSTKAAAAADPNASLLTGTKLASMLLPASAMPGSLKPDPSGSVNTGTVFNEPSSAAVPASKACASLDGTAWINVAGVGSGSFAQGDFTDSYSNLLGQEVDAYRGSDAQTVMTDLRHVFAECATFQLNQGGKNYTQKLTAKTLPGVGDDTVEAVFTSPSFLGGTTLVASRVGNLVVTVVYSDQGSTGGAAVGLAKRIVKNAAAH